MAWTKLNHECPLPNTRKIGAGRGSVWRCECGRSYTLVRPGTDFRTDRWEPVDEQRTEITEGGG